MEKTLENLRKNGFEVSRFRTGAEAADYIVENLRGKTVGIGGSMTVQSLGLYDRLRSDNTVYWHLADPGDETMLSASTAQTYITSANAVSEEGFILNIDGRGNRVAGTLMRKEKVYVIVGRNKLCGPFSEALERARGVASPLNARRLGKKTPCALSEDMRCYDCASPERICSALVVLWRRPFWCESMELVLIDEDLGF